MFMFNTAASLSFKNFQHIHQDFGFRGISCHQFPTMAAMNRNVTVIWDDSQEEKVDFKPPTPPASGFHSILPVLPVDDPTGGMGWDVKIGQGPVTLAQPVVPMETSTPMRPRIVFFGSKRIHEFQQFMN